MYHILCFVKVMKHNNGHELHKIQHKFILNNDDAVFIKDIYSTSGNNYDLINLTHTNKDNQAGRHTHSNVHPYHRLS